MKRFITVILIVVFFVTSYSFAQAVQPDKAPKEKPPKKNVVVQQNRKNVATDEAALSPREIAKQRQTIRKLNAITVQTTNPEIVEEVEEIVEEQENAEEGAEEAIEEVNKRSNVLKFLIGPDYKNLGQLRKEIVHVRNNIRKLQQISAKAGDEDQEAIEGAISELQDKQISMQMTIGEKLEGFSLFGWLSRWLSGYNSTEGPTESPVPSATPTATGSAEPTGTPSGTPSATPTESPVATESPEPTKTPSTGPTASPQ